MQGFFQAAPGRPRGWLEPMLPGAWGFSASCGANGLHLPKVRHAQAVRGLGSGMGTLRLQHPDALNFSPRLGDLSVAAGRGRLKWEQRLEKAGGARPGGRAAGERDPGGAARRAPGRSGGRGHSPGRGERRREPAAARHHAARGAAGGRPGIYRALSVLHEPWGGYQFGGWEREGNQSQPGQEKRRRRTRRA